VSDTNHKPITQQRNLAKLPPALAPLIERPQWCVWRWTQKPGGSWQKPPFMATQPERHASTNDPETWTDYPTALAAVQAGHADGISYVLTENDPFAAIDIDNCRHTTHSIDPWAQLFMQYAVTSYQEVTPSGDDWGVIWGERRKAAAAAAMPVNVNSFNGNGSGYSVDQIEQIVRTGAPEGANRSDVFHTVVGHYLGCGWTAEQILTHLQQFSQGISERYLREDRLHKEIARSASKYTAAQLPVSAADGWANGWEAKTPQPEPEPEPEEQEPPELEDEELDEEPEHDPHLPRFYGPYIPDDRPLKAWLIKNFMPQVGHGLMSGQFSAGKTFVFFELAGSLMTGQPFVGHMVKRQRYSLGAALSHCVNSCWSCAYASSSSSYRAAIVLN
jgi:hypothetical protein